MSNFEKALKELNDEWLDSLPNPDDLPEINLSEEYKEWEKRVIRGYKTKENASSCQDQNVSQSREPVS